MNQTERIIGSEILRKLPYEPNNQQMEIIAALSKFVADTDDRSVFLLNGYAGTGKTSLAGALVAALPALRRQAVLLAPTGRAAKVFAAYSRHSAFTIHRKIYQSRRYNPEDSHFCLARNNQQMEIIAALSKFVADTDDRSVFLLNGYAGTGKTSLAGALVAALPALRRQAVLLAPTGRAAKVFAAYSRHSAFTIHRKIYQSRRYNPEDSHFCLARNNHKNTLFIVDEASMIANNASEGAVFGTGCLLDDLITYVYSGEGCRLILLGDVAQLPPVGYTDSPALAPATLQGYALTVYSFSLTEVARQRSSSGILHNATMIRQIIASGKLEAPTLEISGFDDVEVVSGEFLSEKVEECYAQEGGAAETIIITRSNKRAVMFNQGIRARVLYMDAEITTGDMLLVAKNNYFWAADYDGIDFIANGDVAVVKRISEVTEEYGFRFADVTLEFPDYNNAEIDAKIILDALYAESPALSREQNNNLYLRVMDDYAHITRKSEKYKRLKQDPFFNALQVKFAYSVTCHKAQGGQWRNVFVDMGYIPEEAFSNVDFYRWLYTSFTRATDHIFLINPPLSTR